MVFQGVTFCGEKDKECQKLWKILQINSSKIKGAWKEQRKFIHSLGEECLNGERKLFWYKAVSAFVFISCKILKKSLGLINHNTSYQNHNERSSSPRISVQVHLLMKLLQLHHSHKGTASLSTTIDMLCSGEMQVFGDRSHAYYDRLLWVSWC